jgi:hypothetical protein
MHVIYWVVGVPLALLFLWLALCAVVWAWYAISGHKSDHSGDGGLAVFALPFIPFVIAREYLRRIFL